MSVEIAEVKSWLSEIRRIGKSFDVPFIENGGESINSVQNMAGPVMILVDIVEIDEAWVSSGNISRNVYIGRAKVDTSAGRTRRVGFSRIIVASQLSSSGDEYMNELLERKTDK